MIFIYPDYRVDPVKKWSYTFNLSKVHIVRFYKLTAGIVYLRSIYVVITPFLSELDG